MGAGLRNLNHITASLKSRTFRLTDKVKPCRYFFIVILSEAKNLSSRWQRLSPALAPGASVGRSERSLRVTYMESLCE